METHRMPALFIGHGNPMNALEDNEFSRAWSEAAKALPRPRAILCVSAHWESEGAFVTATERPPTIHDFYGFPRELFEVQYPAPGATELAEQVRALITTAEVQPDRSWGFDHGAWSVLCRMFPDASIPVAQLSLDRTRDASSHYELGRQLRELRERGVLILGSGNIVHNLRVMVWREAAFDWALDFDAQVARWILAGDHDAVIRYERHGQPAELSVNTAEHYLPLLYVLGVQHEGERVGFFADKIWGGSLSMRCVRVG